MTTDTALQEALASLPATVELCYVDYRGQLTDEQVALLLDGDLEGLDESFWEWEADQRYYGVRYLLDELDSDVREALEADPAALEVFEQACYDRDVSDPLRDLIRQTPAQMVRYSLDHVVDPYPWLEDDDTVEDRAAGIASAAGIDYDRNATALRSLVLEASYGGQLCVLHRTDLGDITSHRGYHATFTDPHLLVYDGLNGSGHCEQISGTVTVLLNDQTLRHDAGPYSWSDDIAGVYHPAFETPVTFEGDE